MVLVDLTVDGGGGLLMTVLGDVLVHDGWGDLLVDGGVMMTCLAPVSRASAISHKNAKMTSGGSGSGKAE